MERQTGHNNVEEERILIPFDFKMLPVSDHTVRFNDQLYMDDNILDCGSYSRKKEDVKQMIYCQYPYKLLVAAVIICLKGEFKCRLNQRDIVLDDNSVLVSIPGAIIEDMCINPEAKIAACALAVGDRKFLEHIPSKSMDEISKLLLKYGNPLLFHLDEKHISTLLDIYRTERSIAQTIGEEYADETCNIFMSNIICLLASSSKDDTSDASVPRSREAEVLTKFMQDVQEFAVRERSVSFYAGRACLSPKYFSRIITRKSGKKPGFWIKGYVILEAKTMLASGKFTVQQISDRLSFANPSFFCKYFKAETGMSPGQYVKQRMGKSLQNPSGEVR